MTTTNGKTTATAAEATAAIDRVANELTLSDVLRRGGTVAVAPKTPEPNDVAARAADAIAACEKSAAQIESCIATVQEMAMNVVETGNQLAADFRRRAETFGKIVERFAGVHEKHFGVVDQLRAEFDALDKAGHNG